MAADDKFDSSYNKQKQNDMSGKLWKSLKYHSFE